MAQRHFLVVDGNKYYLLPGTDADQLADRLLQAAKRGGDVVELEVVGSKQLRVVVTPGAPVLIESETIPVEEPASDDDGPNDTDYYNEYGTPD